MQIILLENVLNCFQLTTLAIMTFPADAPYLEIFSQNATPSMKLKQLTEDVTRHGTHEKFQPIGGTFLHTALFGWWYSIGGVHLVFHNLVAIYHVKQHTKCLSGFEELCEISYRDHILAASIMDACRNSSRSR